jgi:hypothetical protein
MSTETDDAAEAALIARETLIHNEKIKLHAAWKNGISVALGFSVMLTLPAAIIVLDRKSPAGEFALFLLLFMAAIGFVVLRQSADRELDNLR